VRDVREADRARTGGVRVRRGRILRSVLPTLETGMERALRLGREGERAPIPVPAVGAAGQPAAAP
ncbi:MAG: hypothetical protein ACE5DS_10725, partial [Kiloniellaceae bacterium]